MTTDKTREVAIQLAQQARPDTFDAVIVWAWEDSARRLNGMIFFDKAGRFADGTDVRTSEVRSYTKGHPQIVTTLSGTRYLVLDGNATKAAEAALSAANDAVPAFSLNPDAIRAAGALLQSQCFGAEQASGWNDHKPTGLDLVRVIREPANELEKLLAGALVAQKLCLSHSEISEAMEGHRKGLMDDKLPHRPMIEVEIADAVIRLFALAGALGMDVGGAIAEKMGFNAARLGLMVEARAAVGGKAY